MFEMDEFSQSSAHPLSTNASVHFCVMKTQKWVYLKQVLHVVYSCPDALFISLPPFLSVYKRSSSDGPVPYAGQARGIRVAGDPGNGDLQYPKPATPVHRLRQLRAQVGSGHTCAFMCCRNTVFGGTFQGSIYSMLLLRNQFSHICSVRHR